MNENDDPNGAFLPADRRPAKQNGSNHTHGDSGPGGMNERRQGEFRTRPAAAPKSETGWQIAEVLLRRWRWAVLGGCLCAALGLAGGLKIFTRTCTAVALLLRYEPLATGDFLKPPQLSDDTLASMLKSPELLKNAGSSLQPAASAEMMAKSVAIKVEPDSDVVKVAVKARSPQWAVDAANLYADEAVKFMRELQKREAEQVSKNFLKERLNQMEGDIGALDKQFRALPESELLTGQLSQLRGTVTNLNQQMQMPAISRSPGASTMLRQQLDTAVVELARLTHIYTDIHPLVQQQRAEVESLQKEVAQTPGSSAAGGSAGGMGFSPDYEIIRTKLQALANSRQILADREQEAKSFAENPPGNVRLFTPATLKGVLPDHYWLKVGLVTVGGGLMGIVFAMAGVLLVEFVDSRLKTTVDVERVTRLPVIATLDNLHEKGAEARRKWAFRAWTALQGRLSPSANHGLVCGITSSRAGEGRSTWIKLLADAASMSGFRVLTIATRSAADEADEPEDVLGRILAGNSGDITSNTLTTNVLARPYEVTEQFTGSNPQPSVHIPLPGWVWNLERRQQWQEALKQWRTVENLVILVELPPAAISEAVLLGQNLPNLIWLACSGMADAGETRAQLETLRHGRCHLVGAVLNREPAAPLKSRFPRWLGCLAVGCALGATATRAQELATPDLTNVPPPLMAISEPDDTNVPASTNNLSFSVVNPAKRADWQKHLTLGPGDILNFSLYGQPELSRQDVFIGPDGRVGFLEAQNVAAAGLTVDELRTNMDQELSKYHRAPRTIITPVAYRSKRYYVLGRVIQRGAYALDQPLTVLEAVARAHGIETALSDRNSIDLADLQKSFLARHGKRIPLDFEKLFGQGDLSQNIPIEPDDYLYFPAANLKEVYVLGEVRLPGVVSFTSDLTAVGAIAKRGGFTDNAYKSHVVVIRGSFNHPQTFIVNTLAVFDARGQDFQLKAKDIIYVSGRPFLRAEQLLDLAISAYIEASTAEWAGKYIGPLIKPGAFPGPP